MLVMRNSEIDFKDGKISTIFNKLLIPTLLGVLSMSAMTAIDGIIVGHGVGATGVASVNIAVPIYQIMSGIGLMIGSGCSVIASILLSQNKLIAARLNVMHALIASSLFALAVCSMAFSFPEETARILGSSDSLLPHVSGYIFWLMPSFIFQMWSFIGLFIIRMDGSPKYAMWCNIIPASMNAFLDWVFVFPLGMGVKGAAIATSISITLGGLMTISYLLFFSDKFSLVSLATALEHIKMLYKNVSRQCRIGSSSLFGELALSLLIYFGNITFMKYLGDSGVGAFGITCYYMPFFFLVGSAIAQSAQPIISYNYGISDYERISKTKRLMLWYSASIGMAVTICFIIFPKALVGLFVDPSTEASQIAIKGFPLIATGIIAFIINISIIGYYQSIEKVKRATLIVFLRGCIIMIPCFILLPIFFGEPGIWLAMPATEWIVLAIILSIRTRKTLK